MNFINLKKVLILSSALLTFGNISDATDLLKPIINYRSNGNLTDNVKCGSFTGMLNSIKRGISDYINNSGNIENILNNICNNQTSQIFANSSNNKILFIINSVLDDNETISSSSEQNTVVQNVNHLIGCLKLIKQIDNLASNQGNPNDMQLMASNNAYGLFKQIALGIDDNAMTKLEEQIRKDYNESNNVDLFIKTLEEVSKVSKYKMEQNDAEYFNSLLNSQSKDNMFVVSPNNKLCYNRSDDANSANIKHSQVLDEIMKLINTEFVMTANDYNMLSNLVEFIDTKKVLNEINTNHTIKEQVITSAYEFSQLITDISKGNIKNNIDINDIKMLEDRMNKLTLNEIKEWYKQIKEGKITTEEKQVFDYYQNTYLKELQDKQSKKEQLSQEEEAILKYEEEHKKPQDDNISKYNIPGISDVLEKKGLTITGIKPCSSVPEEFKNQNRIHLNALSALIASGEGTVVIDAHMGSRAIFEPQDRLSRTAIGQPIIKKLGFGNELIKEIMKPENNYLIITIEKQLPMK